MSPLIFFFALFSLFAFVVLRCSNGQRRIPASAAAHFEALAIGRGSVRSLARSSAHSWLVPVCLSLVAFRLRFRVALFGSPSLTTDLSLSLSPLEPPASPGLTYSKHTLHQDHCTCAPPTPVKERKKKENVSIHFSVEERILNPI